MPSPAFDALVMHRDLADPGVVSFSGTKQKVSNTHVSPESISVFTGPLMEGSVAVEHRDWVALLALLPVQQSGPASTSESQFG